jgi:methionyl-tRNA synthetase
MRDVVIIGPPPTPNGDLHVGHMAGPYLAADVHARYLRANGRAVTYATGTDDNQTYVLASAEKLGVTPEALCGRSWHEIGGTLASMGVSVDGFAPMDARYREAVLEFLGELHASGKLRLRTVRLPYSERHGEFLMEGLIEGECPTCLAESRGGQCETCGHAVDFDALLNPRSRLDPTDVLKVREARILVLPLEDYREELTRYHAAQLGRWRPHLVQFAREALARPLPDFAITYPTRWGIAAPFPETPGQVINAWAEGMAQWMYCTAHAAGADGLWQRDRDTQLVYFLGFDNGFICSIAHVALLLAHGDRYVLPDMIVSNEFYELEHEKFSTSAGHVIGVQELLAEAPRDLARFYLALTCPEHQRTNFGRAAMAEITSRRLVEPWNGLADLLAGQASPDVTEGGWTRAGVILERFGACYELPAFSLTRAADLIAMQLERLRRSAAQRVDGDIFLETRALIAGAAPILIDVTAAAAEAGGFDGTFGASLTPAPFALPRLAASELAEAAR